MARRENSSTALISTPFESLRWLNYCFRAKRLDRKCVGARSLSRARQNPISQCCVIATEIKKLKAHMKTTHKLGSSARGEQRFIRLKIKISSELFSIRPGKIKLIEVIAELCYTFFRLCMTALFARRKYVRARHSAHTTEQFELKLIEMFSHLINFMLSPPHDLWRDFSTSNECALWRELKWRCKLARFFFATNTFTHSTAPSRKGTTIIILSS